MLVQNAQNRQLLYDDFYYLSDSVLAKFKMLQSFDPFSDFPGYRLEQAYLIWCQCPLQLLNAIAEANGLPQSSEPILPGITIRLITGSH